jgi:hypothetical protein
VFSGLHETLRHNDVDTLLGNARLIVRYPQGEERDQEASRLIHHAMYASTLGHITMEERCEILAILRPCCLDLFIRTPATDEPGTAPSHDFSVLPAGKASA